MNTLRIIIPIAACVFLSGCTHMFSATNANWPWTEEKRPTVPTCRAPEQCNKQDALKALAQAAYYCRDVQNYYEAGGQRANTSKMGIAWVGAIAGSVIAPIANGTAVKAWSGLSGATNGLQDAFSEAYSSNISINRRIAVRRAAIGGIDEFNKHPNDPNTQIAIALKMAMACSMGSAIADQNVMEALVNINKAQDASGAQ